MGTGASATAAPTAAPTSAHHASFYIGDIGDRESFEGEEWWWAAQAGEASQKTEGARGEAGGGGRSGGEASLGEPGAPTKLGKQGGGEASLAEPGATTVVDMGDISTSGKVAGVQATGGRQSGGAAGFAFAYEEQCKANGAVAALSGGEEEGGEEGE